MSFNQKELFWNREFDGTLSKMVMNSARRHRIMTKFRKVVHEIGRQRLGTDFDTKVEHPLSLADLKPRDSTDDR